MVDLLIVQTPTDKRTEILGRIGVYEARIAQAKHDLARVKATIEQWFLRTVFTARSEGKPLSAECGRDRLNQSPFGLQPLPSVAVESGEVIKRDQRVGT